MRRSGPKEIELNNNVQWNSCKALLLNLHTFLPQCLLDRCCCLRPSREQKRVSKTYRKLLREISVERILRQLRVLNAAARQGRSVEEWKYLLENNSLKAYANIEDSDSDFDSVPAANASSYSDISMLGI